MKSLLQGEIGSDGSYGLVLEGGELKVQVGYKVEAILAPLKSQVVDRLKAAIPGTVDDVILDKLWDALIKAIGDEA